MRGWDAGKQRSGKWQTLEVGEGFTLFRYVGTADWRSGNRAGLIKRDNQAGEERKKKRRGNRTLETYKETKMTKLGSPQNVMDEMSVIFRHDKVLLHVLANA